MASTPSTGAPAGYGKTTLIAAWLNGPGARLPVAPHVAWLSLEENDNDPIRFLTYVIVIWACDLADDQVKGFLVERGTPGFTTEKMETKLDYNVGRFVADAEAI